MDPLPIIHDRCIYASYNFQLVMSLPECPWDLGSAPAERGGGWVSTMGPDSMAASGLRKSLVGTG